MTPSTLVIDKRIRGVGRVKKATGTTNPAVYRKMERMLVALADEARLDVLRAIRDNELSMLEALDAYQRKTLDRLPLGPLAKPAHVAMREWITSLRTDGPSPDCSAKHKISLGTSTNYIERHNPKATVADLPRVLDALKDEMASMPRSFNLLRSACMAFVRARLKRSHPLWLELAAVEPRKIKATTKRSPLTIDQLRNWFPNPATDPTDAIAWGMATTGMGAGEYWGKWSVRSDHVHIIGTKRKARVRDVPLIWVPAVPMIHHRTFEDHVRERTNRQITPYDLRRTYANWLEAAGISRTRRKLYLGHGAGDVTGLYERHEVTAFLSDDAQKLRSALNLPPVTAAIRLVEEA